MTSRGEVSPRFPGAGRAALLLGLVLAGAIAFVVAVEGSGASRAWQAYLVNFVFWTGLASGAVLLSAVLTLTGARWAGPVKRLAEAFGAFLPVSLPLFGILWFGRAAFFPALAVAPLPRRVWLAPAFLFPRDGAALLALVVAGLALVANAVRRDRGGVPDPGPRAAVLAAVFALLYALVLSLIGFDWIMSLDPHWTSTLFGVYYFVGSFYAGLAAVAVVAGLHAGPLGLEERQLRDLGTLLLAFAFTTGYLFYVQFLVIWFGNVPAETSFLILRLRESPWAPVGRTVLAVGFCLPVLVLLFRRAKARPGILVAVGCVALAGLWLERFVLVAPSLSHGPALPFGLTELLVTAGFFGLVGLPVSTFLSRLGPRAGEESRGKR